MIRLPILLIYFWAVGWGKAAGQRIDRSDHHDKTAYAANLLSGCGMGTAINSTKLISLQIPFRHQSPKGPAVK